MIEEIPSQVGIVPWEKPRIFLEKVVLENFKSYSSNNDSACFHPGFTAVVGPNGSGKSNLLEALIFAFGKRASKIRLSKLQELIHKSNSCKAAEYASVTVHLRTSDGNLNLKINRTILANGGSVYKIDDSKVSQEDLMNCLSRLGIDIQHNRFMILQGEVEMISSMPPKCGYEDEMGKPVSKEGLLEYFDDLIGTKPMHFALKDAQALINELCEKLPGLNTKHQIEMQHKTNLNESMQKIVKYIRMHLDYFKLKNVDLHFKKRNEEDELENIKGKIDESQKQKKLAEYKYQALKDEYKELVEAINKLKKEKKDADYFLEEKKKKMIDFEARKQELTQEQTSTQEKHRKSKEKDEGFKINSTKFEIELTNAFKESQQFALKHDSETAGLNRVKAELEPLLQVIYTELQPFQSDLSSIWQQRLTLEGKQQATETKLQNTKAEKQALEERAAEGKQTLEQVATRLKEMQDALIDAAKEYAELSRREDELRPKIQQQEGNLGEEEKALKQLEQELVSAQAQLSKASRTARKKDYRYDLHTRISSAMKTGKLPGVLGRLGDLGQVQRRLDVAISTAYHGEMDDYVARTLKDAEALIVFLKDEQIGRIRVLILDKLADANVHFQTPDPAATRIYDEIQMTRVYPEVAKAFYHVFRDTLITKDLENARRIAFELEKRWQVVTSSGEVIRPGGEMQGFAKPRSGSIKVIGTNTMEVEEVDDSLQIEVEKKTEEMKALGAQLQGEKYELHTAMRQLQTLKIEKMDCADKMKVLKSEIDQVSGLMENESSTDHNEQSSTRDFIKDIRILELQLANTERELATLQHQEDLIQERMSAIKSSEVKELEAQEKKLKNNLDTIELNQGKLQFTSKRFSRKIAVLQDKLLQNELRMKSYQERLTELQQSLKSIEAKAHTLDDEVTDLQQRIDSYQEQLQQKETNEPKRKRKFEKVSKRIRDATAELKDLENKRILQAIKVQTWVDEIQANHNAYDEQIYIYGEMLEGLSLGDGPEADDTFFSLNPKRIKQENYQLYLLNINEPVDLDKFGPSRPVNSEADTHKKEVEQLIQKLETKLETKPDFNLATQYREVSELIKNLESEISETNEELSAKRVDYMNTRKHRLNLFLSACQQINTSFKQIYSIFTDTGAAEIEFLDSADPFADGLYISVRPPGKSWKKLSSLSGGEKTLVSLSLIFALHEYKPNSIYIMDEIDASLDFINVHNVAEYIRRRRETAQFVVVSLRAQMFEKADQLVGIYKLQDCSTVISICPSAVELQTEDAQNPIIQNILTSP